jgi:hypothetical protein
LTQISAGNQIRNVHIQRLWLALDSSSYQWIKPKMLWAKIAHANLTIRLIMILVNSATFQPQFNPVIKATVQICGKISDALFPNVLFATGGLLCRHARLPTQWFPGALQTQARS